MMKRTIVAIIIAALLVGCEPYHYPLLADRLNATFSPFMEDGIAYPCETNVEAISYFSRTEKDYGFRFDFYDSAMKKVFVIERHFSMTSHGKTKLRTVIAYIDGDEIRMHY